ncbi:MAG: hypothetical protein ACOCTM_02730 [Bacteroidota bacterium]
MSKKYWEPDEDNKGAEDGELAGFYALFGRSTSNQEFENQKNEKDDSADDSSRAEGAGFNETGTKSSPSLDLVAGSNDHNENNDQSTHQTREETSDRRPLAKPLEFYREFESRFCYDTPQLFHTPDKKPVISININGHYEHIYLDSSYFTQLCHYFSIKMNKTPACSSGCINRLRTILSTMAFFEGPEIPLHVRYAHYDGAVYIDLANEAWQQVKITANGWEIIDNTNSPVKFIRETGMKAMPIPQKGSHITDLSPLINADSEEWVLLVSWILGAMNPSGPFPLLILQGQQGSAKSTTAKLLRDLIDPSTVPIQSLPKSERDLIIAAKNSWVLNLDNLSGISPRLADAFCRISTGGGFRARTLYQNSKETLFSIKRPVIMNGITDVSTRSDFLDRCIIVNMPVIPNRKRLREYELNSYWEEHKAGIFGHLCDSISTALSDYQKVNIPEPPRMADFAHWVTAAEPAIGWESGAFLNAYENKRKQLNEITIEANPVASAVLRLMAHVKGQEWIGTPSELLSALELYTNERTVKSKEWPKAPNALSNQLSRIAPSLQEKGILIERGKSGSRSIMITQLETETHDANESHAEEDLSDTGEIEISIEEDI